MNSFSKSKCGAGEASIPWYFAKYSELEMSFTDSPKTKIKSPFCLKSKDMIFDLSSITPIIPIVGVGKTGTSFPPITDWL